jgi:hypothetical protein
MGHGDQANCGGTQLSYVLTQFMAPRAIVRFRFIVAVTATMLAFGFVALIILGV